MDDTNILGGLVPIFCENPTDVQKWLDMGFDLVDNYLCIPYEALFPIGSTLDLIAVREDAEFLY